MRRPFKDLEGLASALELESYDVMDPDHPKQYHPDLPKLGGVEPECTVGLLSWDETRLLVCALGGGVEIIPRSALSTPTAHSRLVDELVEAAEDFVAASDDGPDPDRLLNALAALKEKS